MFDFSNVSKSTAILEIIILMLVAAIIGFVIAWLYWRAKYKKLEGEFADYKKAAEEKEAGLNARIKELEGELETFKAELKITQEKLKALQLIQIKYDTLETKHRGLENEFGELTDNYNALLTKNAGLGAQVTDLSAEVAGLKAETAKQEGEIAKRNKELAKQKKEIVALKKEIAALKKGGKGKKKTPVKSKDDILEDIKSKRDTINYELIGSGNEKEKDDLKVIKGIGPWIEQKLFALGIFNYHQIALFDEPTIQKVTDALEAFPGRIQRDDWIGQAKAFTNPPRKDEDGS